MNILSQGILLYLKDSYYPISHELSRGGQVHCWVELDQIWRDANQNGVKLSRKSIKCALSILVCERLIYCDHGNYKFR